jgi:predicted alpha/beta hydrolase family esterase
MFSYQRLEDAYKYVQENQPVAWTGAGLHAVRWLFSSRSDVVHENPNYNPSPDLPSIAIYCVHGTADRVSAFDLIAARAKKNLPAGVSGIHQIAFHSRGRGNTIENYADQCAEKITANRHKNVIFLAHSRGVIVAAKFTEEKAKELGITVHAVIGIGGPYKGSWWAGAMPFSLLPGATQQLGNTEYLAALCEKISKSNVPYFNFAAENDFIVAEESTYVHKDGKGAGVTLSRHGHLSIMSSQRLVDHTQTYIQRIMPRSEELADLNTVQAQVETISDAEINKILQLICDEIDNRIADLKSRWTLWSAATKELLLTSLKTQLTDLMLCKRAEDYNNTKSIGDFINAFLDTEKTPDKKTAREAFNESLVLPKLFVETQATTLSFVVKIAEKYQEIPLPSFFKYEEIPEEGLGVILGSNRT